MGNWPTIEALVDGVMLQTFGEPVVYQPVQAGAAQGDRTSRFSSIRDLENNGAASGHGHDRPRMHLNRALGYPPTWQFSGCWG